MIRNKEIKAPELEAYVKPLNTRNEVKSVERPFNGPPALTNKKPEPTLPSIMQIRGFDASVNSDNKYANEDTKSSQKHDLVDAISEAANKLLKDPNSYYHNINKNDKVHTPKLLEMEKEEMAREIPKVDLNVQYTFNKNAVSQNKVTPIVPYPKPKPQAQKMVVKLSPQKPQISLKDHSKNIESEADKRKKLFESKPIIKKKVDPPQVKLPPPPIYERLPCLDCKNIQNVCETLKISKIEDVVKIVQDNNHSKE
jgi:hypothetical protein